MKRKHVPTTLDDNFDELVAKITTDREPLVLVLRGHLITELLINDLLHTFEQVGMSEAELAVVTGSSYFAKLEALNEHELIPARLYKPLLAFNKIRNSFAHLPIKIDVTEADEKSLLQSFAAADRKAIEKSASEYTHLISHSTLRSCLTELYVMLNPLVRNFRQFGPAMFPESMLAPRGKRRSKRTPKP